MVNCSFVCGAGGTFAGGTFAGAASCGGEEASDVCLISFFK